MVASGLLIVGFGSTGWRTLLLGGLIKIGLGVSSMHYKNRHGRDEDAGTRSGTANTLVVLFPWSSRWWPANRPPPVGPPEG